MPESELVLTMELVQSPQEQTRMKLIDQKKPEGEIKPSPINQEEEEEAGNNEVAAINEEERNAESANN